MNKITWATIPHVILVEVFNNLSNQDRFNSSLACKWWSECFQHPSLWRKIELRFDVRETGATNAESVITKYCNTLKELDVSACVIDSESRKEMLDTMEALSRSPKRQLKKFSFRFIGLNPEMFKGNYVLATLKNMFSQNIESSPYFRLTFLDLNNCNVAFDDELIEILVQNHPLLRVVRLQNACLVDNVTSTAFLHLTEKCILLEELQTFYHCIDQHVIEVLATPERQNKFKHLSLLCHRAAIHKDPIPDESWERFSAFQTICQIDIKFSEHYSQWDIIPFLKRAMALTGLYIKLYDNYQDILHYIVTYHSQTIKHLTFFHEPSGSLLAPADFEIDLMYLFIILPHLNELFCDHILSERTVEYVITTCKVSKYRFWVKTGEQVTLVKN